MADHSVRTAQEKRYQFHHEVRRSHTQEAEQANQESEVSKAKPLPQPEPQSSIFQDVRNAYLKYTAPTPKDTTETDRGDPDKLSIAGTDALAKFYELRKDPTKQGDAVIQLNVAEGCFSRAALLDSPRGAEAHRVNLAQVYVLQGDHMEAGRVLEQNYTEVDNRDRLAYLVNSDLADLNVHAGKFENAADLAESAVKNADRGGTDYDRFYARIKQGKVYEATALKLLQANVDINGKLSPAQKERNSRVAESLVRDAKSAYAEAGKISVKDPKQNAHLQRIFTRRDAQAKTTPQIIANDYSAGLDREVARLEGVAAEREALRKGQ